MSDVLFPDLILGGEFVKKPMFNTRIMTSVNGRELRASYQAIPKYEITLNLPLLDQRTKDINVIEEFFNARRGSFDSFLFRMPWDDMSDCTFVGDGILSSFQLYKDSTPLMHTETFKSDDPFMWSANQLEPMWNDPQSIMWVMQYSISKNGLLTLDVPLAQNDVLNIKHPYFYKCRFSDDSQSFSLFSYKLWKGEITLIGSLGNKV